MTTTATGTQRPAWLVGTLAELRRLTSRPLARLRHGRLPFAFISAGAVLLLWVAQMFPIGSYMVRGDGDVDPSTPLWLAILRLPVSMYAPAQPAGLGGVSPRFWSSSESWRRGSAGVARSPSRWSPRSSARCPAGSWSSSARTA